MVTQGQQSVLVHLGCAAVVPCKQIFHLLKALRLMEFIKFCPNMVVCFQPRSWGACPTIFWR